MGNDANVTRRSRWLVWSLLLPLATFSATAAVMSIPLNQRGIDVVAGRDLFRAHCGSCHFAKVGFPSHHGPNLYDIGRSGRNRKPNMTAAEYILESILEPSAFVAPSSRPGMPQNVAAELPPEDIRNIVGFLASCAAYADFDQIAQLDIPDRRTPAGPPTPVRLEDMQLAEQVLRDKGACLQCHRLHSVPECRIFAPALFNAGLTDVKQLHESLVNPYKELKPNYASVSVVLANGQVVAGRLLSRTDQALTLRMRDDKNELVVRDIPLAEIEQEDGQPLIEPSPTSIMPTGFDKLLTEREIQALLTLIRQLN
jgi:putative heme-binding domain-containing protein